MKLSLKRIRQSVAQWHRYIVNKHNIQNSTSATVRSAALWERRQIKSDS